MINKDKIDSYLNEVRSKTDSYTELLAAMHRMLLIFSILSFTWFLGTVYLGVRLYLLESDVDKLTIMIRSLG